MPRLPRTRKQIGPALAVALALTCLGGNAPVDGTPSGRFIVQAADPAAARQAVERVGATVTHELGIIHAVGAELSAAQRRQLDVDPGLRLYPDGALVTSASSCSVSGAESLDHSGDKVKWELTNLGTDAVRIEAITIYWPEDFGDLLEVKFHGKIFNGRLAGGSAVLDSAWYGDAEDRELEPGKERKLELKFDERGQAVDGMLVHVAFSGGCAVDFGRCRVSGGNELVFDGKKVVWPISNLGSLAATLDGLSLSWPRGTGELKKVKLGSANLYAQPVAGGSLTIDGEWDADAAQRSLAQFSVTELVLEFKNDVPPSPGSYELSAGFAQGCSAAYSAPTVRTRNAGPGPNACGVSGQPRLVFDGKKIRWDLTNEGPVDRTVESVALHWPAANRELRKLQLDGSFFDSERQPSWAVITDGWKDKPEKRTVEAGATRTLQIEFKEDALPIEAEYALAVDFGDDCRVEFASGDFLDDGYATVETHFPRHVRADRLHRESVTGRGVTVAVLDTGNSLVSPTMNYNADRNWRFLAQYDALEDEMLQYGDTSFGAVELDGNGHGGHVASVALSAKSTSDGSYNGVAPGADLVVVRAFDKHGAGSYLDVIRGVDWVVANRDAYGIRVLNLSFSAEPRSHYWDDPLNQAVMAAWRAGIVVVASAGNRGPDAMTIGVPGNVPYVITVGAMSDNFTPRKGHDDVLASFSSAGPTAEGFVKPEVVAPGGHILGMTGWFTELGHGHPDYRDAYPYFEMSGTSQATAVVSGVVSLLLENEPWLTPDQVKLRLMETARPALAASVGNNGASGKAGLAYSVFQQGAGLVDAYAAAHSGSTESANRGLDVDLDLAGIEHYRGRANRDADGNYYLEGREDLVHNGNFVWSNGFIWNDSFAWSDGYVWNDAFAWNDSYMWSDAFVWSDGFAWNDAHAWSDAYLWSDAHRAEVSINQWVEAE